MKPREVYKREEQKRIFRDAVQNYYASFTTTEQYEAYHNQKIDELFNPLREDHYFEYGTD